MSEIAALDPPKANFEPDHPEPHAKPTGMASRVLSTDELRNLPAPVWLVEHLVHRGALVNLYGPPGIGKTFLALSMVLSLATQVRFLGHTIPKPTRTLYVIGEGSSGIGARVDAWQAHHDVDESPDVLWLPEATQLASPTAIDSLVDVVQERECGAVVFDTFARCTVGVQENSSADVGQVVANIDRLRCKTDAAVILVHHSGKDVTRGSRGSNALEGAVETELEISDGRLTVRKQKNAAAEPPIAFRLQPVRDSLVPIYGDDGDNQGGTNDTALSALIELRDAATEEGLSSTRWSDCAGQPDRTFHRSKKALVDAGLVINIGTARQTRWVPTEEGKKAVAV